MKEANSKLSAENEVLRKKNMARSGTADDVDTLSGMKHIHQLARRVESLQDENKHLLLLKNQMDLEISSLKSQLSGLQGLEEEMKNFDQEIDLFLKDNALNQFNTQLKTNSFGSKVVFFTKELLGEVKTLQEENDKKKQIASELMEARSEVAKLKSSIEELKKPSNLDMEEGKQPVKKYDALEEKHSKLVHILNIFFKSYSIDTNDMGLRQMKGHLNAIYNESKELKLKDISANNDVVSKNAWDIQPEQDETDRSIVLQENRGGNDNLSILKQRQSHLENELFKKEQVIFTLSGFINDIPKIQGHYQQLENLNKANLNQISQLKYDINILRSLTFNKASTAEVPEVSMPEEFVCRSCRLREDVKDEIRNVKRESNSAELSLRQEVKRQGKTLSQKDLLLKECNGALKQNVEKYNVLWESVRLMKTSLEEKNRVLNDISLIGSQKLFNVLDKQREDITFLMRNDLEKEYKVEKQVSQMRVLLEKRGSQYEIATKKNKIYEHRLEELEKNSRLKKFEQDSEHIRFAPPIKKSKGEIKNSRIDFTYKNLMVQKKSRRSTQVQRLDTPINVHYVYCVNRKSIWAEILSFLGYYFYLYMNLNNKVNLRLTRHIVMTLFKSVFFILCFYKSSSFTN